MRSYDDSGRDERRTKMHWLLRQSCGWGVVARTILLELEKICLSSTKMWQRIFGFARVRRVRVLLVQLVRRADVPPGFFGPKKMNEVVSHLSERYQQKFIHARIFSLSIGATEQLVQTRDSSHIVLFCTRTTEMQQEASPDATTRTAHSFPGRFCFLVAKVHGGWSYGERSQERVWQDRIQTIAQFESWWVELRGTVSITSMARSKANYCAV